MESEFKIFLLLISSVLCTSLAQICQKKAAIASLKYGMLASFLFTPYLIYSLVLLAVGLVSWLGVLSYLDVSIAYPVLAMNFVFVLIGSRFLLGERVPLKRWLGAFSIVAGVVLLLGAHT